MDPMQQWLLTIVVQELTLKGIKGINIEQLAKIGGVNLHLIRELFPDNHSLIFKLIDVISEMHKESLLPDFKRIDSSKERLIFFIVASIDFIENNQNLAQVIILSLLGNDVAIKERVHDTYERFFTMILDDLLSEGIIPNKSLSIISDLTDTLLSVMYLEGCPWLQMGYLSFVYPRNVAISTIEALKKYFSSELYKDLTT